MPRNTSIMVYISEIGYLANQTVSGLNASSSPASSAVPTPSSRFNAMATASRARKAMYGLRTVRVPLSPKSFKPTASSTEYSGKYLVATVPAFWSLMRKPEMYSCAPLAPRPP